MTDINEVKKALPLIVDNIECFEWEDFKDKGSPCIDWFSLTPTEREEYLTTKFNVESVMDKKSLLYTNLERALANVTGSKWVTYDWAIKAVSRAIAFCDFKEFYKMLTLSRTVKMGMKKRELTQISSLLDVFN